MGRVGIGIDEMLGVFAVGPGDRRSLADDDTGRFEQQMGHVDVDGLLTGHVSVFRASGGIHAEREGTVVTSPVWPIGRVAHQVDSIGPVCKRHAHGEIVVEDLRGLNGHLGAVFGYLDTRFTTQIEVEIHDRQLRGLREHLLVEGVGIHEVGGLDLLDDGSCGRGGLLLPTAGAERQDDGD